MVEKKCFSVSVSLMGHRLVLEIWENPKNERTCRFRFEQCTEKRDFYPRSLQLAQYAGGKRDIPFGLFIEPNLKQVYGLQRFSYVSPTLEVPQEDFKMLFSVVCLSIGADTQLGKVFSRSEIELDFCAEEDSYELSIRDQPLWQPFKPRK